jgi:hypothetical protein
MQGKEKLRKNAPEDEFFEELYCAAFPDGVPPYIRDWGGHFTPKPGDHGIMFELGKNLKMTPELLEYYKEEYPDRNPDAVEKSA